MYVCVRVCVCVLLGSNGESLLASSVPHSATNGPISVSTMSIHQITFLSLSPPLCLCLSHTHTHTHTTRISKLYHQQKTNMTVFQLPFQLV